MSEDTLHRRSITLQSWWVASEFLRRHPDLGLIETHPGGGTYDCLTVINWTGHPNGPLVQLNRNGSLHAGPGDQRVATWKEEGAQANRRQLVLRLESVAGLGAPDRTPRTTPKTLIFRLCYVLLLLGLNDRQPWDVRNARVDTSGLSFDNGNVDGFPTAERAASEGRPDDPYQDSLYRFWKIYRGEDALAIVDVDGVLHRRQRDTVDLVEQFDLCDRSIDLAGAWLRHQLLPVTRD